MLTDVLTAILDVVRAVDPALRATIAALAMVLETSVLVGLVVPGDTIVVVAAAGVASPGEAVVLGLCVVAGALVGESIGFALGRWLGPRIRHSWVGRRIGERNWERAERYLRRRGGVAIFLSRFLPVLHSLVPLTVGMSAYPFRRFLLWTTPACLLWAGISVSVAAGAASGFRELADEAHGAGYVFVAGVVVVLALVALGKRLLHRAERRHLDSPEEDAAGSTAAGGVGD